MPREPEHLAEMRRALGVRLATFRKAAGMTQGHLARATYRDRTTVNHIENGRAGADERFWCAADESCGAGGVLRTAFLELESAKRSHTEHTRTAELREHQAEIESFGPLRASPRETITRPDAGSGDHDEVAALELARRVEASDLGETTLTALEDAFDQLARDYSSTAPAELLERLRTRLGYVAHLLDGRTTLAQHRRLLAIGGWLSLLAATVHTDLKQAAAAEARLRVAVEVARQSGDDELRAWSHETQAWRRLTGGDYRRALDLSRMARQVAPQGSSVEIQATAQEGRALARLGQRRDTLRIVERVHRLVSPRERPQRPEHHYHYDPDKCVSYTATTLAWVGDPAAEEYAREVVRRLRPGAEVKPWPRRVAVAHLDLALTMVTTDRLDEACDTTRRALSSGGIVPSSRWRAAEIVHAVETRGLPEAPELREVYESTRETAGHRTGS